MNAMLLSTTHIEQNKKSRINFTCYLPLQNYHSVVQNALLNNAVNDYNNLAGIRTKTKYVMNTY